MNTKKIVFWSSLIGGIFAFATLYFIYLFPCDFSPEHPCYDSLLHFSNSIVPYLSLFIPLFFLSLITYRLRDEVFTAWWNFARWWVPIIIVITLLQNIGHSQGGLGISGAISGWFDMMILFFFYLILVGGSLLKIFFTYRQIRWTEKGLSSTEQSNKKWKITLSIIAIIILFFVTLFVIG